MGLFGGFKAKFTRNSTSKNKSEDVVCLRYHVHSEFDRQDASIPIQVNNNIRKTEIIPQSKKKERKVVKSAIFPEKKISQTSPTSLTPQKSLSLNNLSITTSTAVNGLESEPAASTNSISVSTTFNVPRNGNSIAVSDTTFGKSTQEHKGIVNEKLAVVANNHLYTTNLNTKNEQHNQTVFSKVSNYDKDGTFLNGDEYMSNTEISFLKPSPKYESTIKENGQKNSDTDHSTLISMTQHSSRSSSFDRSMETNDIKFTKNTLLDSNKIQNNFSQSAYGNQKFGPNMLVSDEEPDYFKINVVQHDLNRTYSYSEDDQSYHEEEEPRFTKMGYSSQAASIFFGEGEESEVVRPRRIQLMEDDERRSSGAEC